MFFVEVSPVELYNLTNGAVRDENDIVTSVAELGARQDDELYFLVGSRTGTKVAAVVEIFGSPVDTHILELANKFTSFVMTEPTLLIKGTVMNPKDLPMSFKSSEVALVIVDDLYYKLFNAMQAATHFIEEQIDEVTNIDSFSVIVGTELKFDNTAWDRITKGGTGGKYLTYGK